MVELPPQPVALPTHRERRTSQHVGLRPDHFGMSAEDAERRAENVKQLGEDAELQSSNVGQSTEAAEQSRRTNEPLLQPASLSWESAAQTGDHVELTLEIFALRADPTRPIFERAAQSPHTA